MPWKFQEVKVMLLEVKEVTLTADFANLVHPKARAEANGAHDQYRYPGLTNKNYTKSGFTKIET